MYHHISDYHLSAFFKQHKIEGSINYIETHGRRLRYCTVGEPHLPTLLFLHGAPACLSMYLDYLNDSYLRKHFRMVAVDRPGYGGSGYGVPEPSVSRQAAMVRELIRKLHNGTSFLLVGCSYGATVACRVLMDDPAIANGLLLDAPAIAPGKENLLDIAPILDISIVRKVMTIPTRVALAEKLQHTQELQAMLPLWPQIAVPTIIVQGEKDRRVFPYNVQFAKRRLTSVAELHTYTYKNTGHLISQKKPVVIKEKIKELFDLVRA